MLILFHVSHFASEPYKDWIQCTKPHKYIPTISNDLYKSVGISIICADMCRTLRILVACRSWCTPDTQCNTYKLSIHTSLFEDAHCLIESRCHVAYRLQAIIWYELIWFVCLNQYGLEWYPCMQCIAHSVTIVHLAQRSIMFFSEWLGAAASLAMPPPIRYKPPLPVRFKALAGPCCSPSLLAVLMLSKPAILPWLPCLAGAKREHPALGSERTRRSAWQGLEEGRFG